MKNKLSANKKSKLKNRATTLSEIDRPLKFFALALLIVEFLIGILSVNASSDLLSDLLLAGTLMFVLVVMMVVLLLFTIPEWLFPTNTKDALDIIREKKLEKKKKLEEQSSFMNDSLKSLNIHIASNRKANEFQFPTADFENIRSNLEQINAMEIIEKELNPKYELDVDVELTNAQLSFMERKFDESWNIVKNILTKHPKNTEAKFLARSIWFGKGRKSRQNGEIEEAISSYKKSLDYDEDYTPSIFNIACNLNLLGKTSESMDFLSKAITKNPKYKKMAKDDDDFESLISNSDPTFLRLVN